MTSLGTLLIGIESGATAINAAAQIVGYAGIDPAREEEWAAQSTAHPKR
jgi:hypothetical protein